MSRPNCIWIVEIAQGAEMSLITFIDTFVWWLVSQKWPCTSHTLTLRGVSRVGWRWANFCSKVKTNPQVRQNKRWKWISSIFPALHHWRISNSWNDSGGFSWSRWKKSWKASEGRTSQWVSGRGSEKKKVGAAWQQGFSKWFSVYLISLHTQTSPSKPHVYSQWESRCCWAVVQYKGICLHGCWH